MKFFRFILVFSLLSAGLTSSVFGESTEYKAGKTAEIMDYCGHFELTESLDNKFGNHEDYLSGKDENDTSNWSGSGGGFEHTEFIDCSLGKFEV